MFYNSFEILPVTIYYKILQSGDLSLLNPEENTTPDDLLGVWDTIHQEFQEKDNNQMNKRIFRITIDIETLASKYNIIQMCIDALRFDRNEDILNILKQHRYFISDKFYNRDLDRAERNAMGILHKISILKDQLPKDTGEKNDSSIHEVLGGFCACLGFNIGEFNKITCPEYIAFKKQVDIKLKSQQEEISKLKSKKNGG